MCTLQRESYSYSNCREYPMKHKKKKVTEVFNIPLFFVEVNKEVAFARRKHILKLKIT